MNKQELIKEVKEIGIYGLNIFGTVVEGIPTKTTIKLIEQLDEPKKVVVPQYIADKIEYARKYDYTIFDAMMMTERDDDFYDWLYTDDNIEVFARAWLDGYEVEKEPKYQVSMKGIDTNFNFLNRHRNENYWIFSSKDKNTLYQTHHTRKQLEDAGFGEVFNSTLFEVEEAEE